MTFGIDLFDWVNMLLTMARVEEEILAFQTPSKGICCTKRSRESADAADSQGLIPEHRKTRLVVSESESIKKAKRDHSSSMRIDSVDTSTSNAKQLDFETNPQVHGENVYLELEPSRHSEVDNLKAGSMETRNEHHA